MANYNILTSIGKKIEKDCYPEDVFLYCGVKYEKLLLWNQFDKLTNLHKSSGFFLQNTFNNGEEYLTLCYSLNTAEKYCSSMAKSQRDFIIKTFFETTNQVPAQDYNEMGFQTLDRFYERLKEEHENDDLSKVPQNVQHASLKETTRLRNYQIRGIKWLLKRELEVEELPSNYIEMHSKFNSQQKIFYSPSTKDFVLQKPDSLYYPRGGLLCDEMGLGKTVEMITLILMNPRKKRGEKRKVDDIDDIPLKTISALKNYKGSRLKCICYQQKKEKEGSLVICSLCFHAQHKKCVGKVEDIFSYICPACYRSTNRVVESKTTIIVTPTSIKKQWMSEISRHVEDKNFKVLLYNGIGSNWISPDEISNYDIVITDFATLSRELYFAQAIDRQLRQTKKFENPPSPLVHVKFWRVILDEAQMVENANNRPAQMVKTLKTINRWGCTGTPIEKGSIYHLHGLISFLGIYPYTNNDNFNGLWNEYRNGRPEKLVEFLSKILWRTRKKDVQEEINIPPQLEIIHFVQMSDLQKCFYERVHQATRPDFQKHIFNFISHYDRESKQRVADYALKNKAIFELNNATLKTLLEPLRKLRQDCTIANIFTANDQTRVKQTLHADQLHDHLVKKTTIECKSALRTICSSLNGIAALKIAKEKYEEATGMYKQVLRLANDYNDAHGVHVDSMLQIHAYNSLIEMAAITQNETELANKEKYTNEMIKFEWKYIKSYYDKVQNINKELDDCKEEFKSAKLNFRDRDGHWWRDIISHDVQQINVEIFSFGVISGLAATTTTGIQLILTKWCDKIELFSREVNKLFKNLDFIVKFLKPTNELNAETNEKISKLAINALDCHLNLFDDNRTELIPKNPSNLCELCMLKHKLDGYECVLFNKTMVNDIVAGSWNPRIEERILKVILNNAKRANVDENDVEMGKCFFKYLEALKKQYKMLAQLWVELNFTVSAFDELKMCKTRMQLVESTDEDARFRLKIAKHEVQAQMEVFTDQKREAELLFSRLNGRLKYLFHLKERNEIPVCPICTIQAKERYYVTVCGHSLCAECFLRLTKEKRRFSNYERLKINCPVCRNQQDIGSLLAVTTNAKVTNEPTINGSYSPKIDEIIRCVLRLRCKEPDVKILIFSEWDSILIAITAGLKDNQISYRTSLSTNFSKQIEEFKDITQGVTCMMLKIKFAGKGLNLTEATHAFMVEPNLNVDEELQAIGRIHRIGQTRETFVHKFITEETIEKKLYDKIIQEKNKWINKQFSIGDLESLFDV